MSERNKIVRLMKLVENTLQEFTQKKETQEEYFYLFDKAIIAKEAIAELKELTIDDKELCALVRNGQVNLINNLNLIKKSYLTNFSPNKIGKNHIYKLLEEFKHNKKYG